MKACFIGHKIVERTEEIVYSLKKTIISLINKGVDTFLFGSKSAFNDLSLEIVSEFKNKYPYIKRIYVRSTNQHINKEYEEYLLKFFDETYFPTKIANSGKYSYVERNYEMIDKSSYCVFYYDKTYSPQASCSRPRKSGTKIAYEYAVKKKKKIINLYMT